MPQKPDDLSKIIREMALKHAKNIGKSLTYDAEMRIGEIPPAYKSEPQIAVDLQQLDFMIKDVIELAARFSKDHIGFDELEKALRGVKCHYLWFC